MDMAKPKNVIQSKSVWFAGGVAYLVSMAFDKVDPEMAYFGMDERAAVVGGLVAIVAAVLRRVTNRPASFTAKISMPNLKKDT